MSDRFPTEVREFIVRNIDSIGQLEVLILMHSQPERSWSIDELAVEQRSSSQMAKTQLESLAAKGILLKTDSRYQLKGQSSIIPQLASLYKDWRSSIIAMIYDKATEKLRGFSDAFRIRKDDK